MGACCSCLCDSITWLFATTVNVGVLILLGLSILHWQNWPAALAGSSVYLLFLILTTQRYHSLEETKAQERQQRQRQQEQAIGNGDAIRNGESNDEDQGDETRESETAHSEHRSSSSSVVDSSSMAGNRVQRSLRRARRRRDASALQNIPFGLSMMYLLVNVILAVPGAIVVFFSFPCPDLVDPLDVRRQVYWKTNMTELPDNVKTWFQDFDIGGGSSSTESSTFVQSSSALYVFGSYNDQPAQLYVVEEVGVEPKPLEYIGEVREITAVTDSTVCFLHKDQEGGFKHYGSHLLCGDYVNGFQETVINRNRYSFGLTGIDGVLWFLQIRADYYVFDPARGGGCNFDAVVRCENCFIPACQADTMKVMSLDLATMTLTSHSQRYTTRRKANHGKRFLQDAEVTSAIEEVEPDDEQQEEGYYENDDDDVAVDGVDLDADDDGVAKEVDSDMFCDGNMLNRMRAFGAFFLSALPLMYNSGRVWVRYAIPSASVTMFVGIGYAMYCIWGFFDPWTAPTGFRLWLYIGTPVWLLVCTYQVVVNPLVSKAPLWWSLYLITTALVLLLVWQEYFEVYNIRALDAEEITLWVIDIFIIHGPLLMITILTKSVYIAFLSIVAFLLLTSIMVWKMTDTIHTTLLYGGIAYAGILFIVLIVYRMRNSLHNVFFKWLSACARHTCAIEAIDDEEEHEENTTGLLLNEEAEPA